MSWDSDKERELERIFALFSGFMRARAYKHQVGRLGVDVEDIVQETRIKIWKLLSNETKINHYASYIKKIVDTSVIDYFRKFKREEGIYFYEKNRRIGENVSTFEADHLYGGMDLKDIVGKAVDGLIPSRRLVVRLYLLNMTVSKTKNLLYRGLKDLRRILKEKSIDYEHL